MKHEARWLNDPMKWTNNLQYGFKLTTKIIQKLPTNSILIIVKLFAIYDEMK